ncbi:hypothetical protein [Alishewanella longhuensis]
MAVDLCAAGTIGEDGIAVTNATGTGRTRESFVVALQGGVGFDARTCGDTLRVICRALLYREQLDVETVIPFYQQDWFWQVVKLVMGGLVIIVLLWGIVRPMLKKMINPVGITSALPKAVCKPLMLTMSMH